MQTRCACFFLLSLWWKFGIEIFALKGLFSFMIWRPVSSQVNRSWEFGTTNLALKMLLSFINWCQNLYFKMVFITVLQGSYSQRNFKNKMKWPLLCFFLKSSLSEKATKLWKNLPLVMTLLSKNSCFVKTGRRLFQILWPSHSVLTLSN